MKKTCSILLIYCLVSLVAVAQQEKTPLWEGNKYYKELDFQKSLEAYNKALSIAPTNPLANYNMGNTQFRLNKFDTAVQMYDNTIANSKNTSDKQKAYYNKGVSLSKQKKLDESIAAYKEALKLNTKDQEARENLQKALLEKKEQDKKDKKDKDDKDKDKKDQDKKDKKQDDQKDQQDKKQQPKDKESKLTKQQVDQLLKSLEQKEKDLQKKMQKTNQNNSGPEKDW